MKKYRLGLTTLIFVIYYLSSNISCKKNENSSSVGNTQINEDVLKPSELVLEKSRSVLRDTWFKETRDVAQRSEDSEAMEIVSFIEKNSVLSEPVPEGSRFLETSNEPEYFSIIPIVFGDNSLGPIWAKYYSPIESGGVAHFQPDVRTIVIKSHIRVTPLWHGIILLHEGRHAREFISRQYNWKDMEIFCKEERDTHDFQNRVTLKIGGNRYHNLVSSLAVDIESKLEEKGYTPGQAILHRSSHIQELEEIFTPALSSLEMNFRETSVWIHANFILLEKRFGEDAPQKKAQYLKMVYSETSTQPN